MVVDEKDLYGKYKDSKDLCIQKLEPIFYYAVIQKTQVGTGGRLMGIGPDAGQLFEALRPR